MFVFFASGRDSEWAHAFRKRSRCCNRDGCLGLYHEMKARLARRRGQSKSRVEDEHPQSMVLAISLS